MTPLFKLSNLGLAISYLVLAGSVQAGEPPPPSLAGTVQHIYCMSGYLDYTDPNAYFSQVFEVRVPQNAKLSFPEDLAEIYEAFLNEKYSYVRTGPLSVMCSASVAAAAVEGGKDMLIKDKRHRNRNVVETGWKPSPQEIQAAASGHAAPVAAAAPAMSPSPAVYGYCKGIAQTKVYFTRVFSSASAQTEAWKESFTAFLDRSYGFQGSVDCSVGEQKGPLEWTWNRQRGLALGRSIDTGWSPES